MNSFFSSVDYVLFRGRVKSLKGTATLMISMFYKKELYKPWILIPVSSKSVKNGKIVVVWIFRNGQ